MESAEYDLKGSKLRLELKTKELKVLELRKNAIAREMANRKEFYKSALKNPQDEIQLPSRVVSINYARNLNQRLPNRFKKSRKSL